MNYEEDMRIDETALDIEWLDQAELALKYVRHYAECRRVLTLADEKIKVVRAELIAKANSDPNKYCHKDKPNIADIESFYRNHKRHKQAKKEWVEAQFECHIAEGAKSEISFTRKATLENLVTLHGQSYFAGPKMPRNITKERKEKQRQVDSKISSKLKRDQ